MGVASWVWVRPIFTIWANSTDFFWSSSYRRRRLGRSLSYVYRTVATCMAVGKVSLDDYDLLTWSLGWTILPYPRIYMALRLRTSLVFMLLYVPDPVYHTTRGNSSLYLSASSSTSVAAFYIAYDISSSNPNSTLTLAIALFMIAKALISSKGILSPTPPILKFWRDLCVYAPHSFSAGTIIGPNVSRSSLNCPELEN